MARTDSTGSSSKPASRGKPAAKPSAPTATSTGTAPAAKTRQRIDWEAVERDYRTGRFTLRELEAKHGAGYAKISTKAKLQGWTKDLADAVRQATAAVLIAEVATARATEGQRATTNVVLAAAEQNAQIILAHRRQLRELGEQAEAARAKLMALGDSAADVREATALMGGLEAYGRILKMRIEKEREAHNVTTAESEPAKDVHKMTPTEAYLHALEGGR